MRYFNKSNELLNRELRVSPLAAQTYSKSYRYFPKGISPSYMEKGEGCYITDVDGNEFVDFICALGPVTIGYNDPEVNEAVIQQVGKFASGSLQSRLEVELAEKLCEILPGAEKVRFLKNGGDATTSAIRLARAYTGRDKILMCGYHGMHDWSIGASENRKGVPGVVSNLTDTFNYNDINDLEMKLRQGDIAAVIMEPIQGNGPLEGYLNKVKEVTHKFGALLIFDEVVSGFRYSLGGAAELYSVSADLAAYGKGMANGYPISVLAGQKDIMNLVEEGAFVSTTFGGDAISMAAALASIRIMERDGFFEHITRIGSIIRDGLNSLVNKYDIGNVVSITGLPAHCGVSFEGVGELSYLDFQTIFSQTMVENGILIYAVYNLCKAHTEKEADMLIMAADKAFASINDAISCGSVKELLKGGRVDPVFKRTN